MIPNILEIAENRANDYQTAHPFPHIVLNDLFPNDILSKVGTEIQTKFEQDNAQPHWVVKDNPQSKKRATAAVETVGPETVSLIEYLNGDEFVAFLSKLSGITNLCADKGLKGGGVHYIENGGFLNIHADFNYHADLKQYRRLNVLIYLNDDWKPEYNGNLELWSTDMKECVHSIPPVFNTCVVFSIGDHAYHGHPEPLACPVGIARKSIAVYYYTDEKPEDTTVGYHSTLYQNTK